jgi:hypothetical protein
VQRPVHDTAFAGDLVDRNFARDRPNELWVTDKSVTGRDAGVRLEGVEKLFVDLLLDTRSQ